MNALLRLTTRRLAGACAFLLPGAMLAQEPTIPAAPSTAAVAGYFPQVGGIWSFSGCATGTITEAAQGTALCLNGLLAIGTTGAGLIEGRVFANLDLNGAIQQRPSNTSAFAELTGTRRDDTCPGGCAFDAPLVGISPGTLADYEWTAPPFVPIGASLGTYSPATLVLGFEYDVTGEGAATGNTFFRTSAFTPVSIAPEPSVLVLLASGVSLLGAGLRRRRHARDAHDGELGLRTALGGITQSARSPQSVRHSRGGGNPPV